MSADVDGDANADASWNADNSKKESNEGIKNRANLVWRVVRKRNVIIFKVAALW